MTNYTAKLVEAAKFGPEFQNYIDVYRAAGKTDQFIYGQLKKLVAQVAQKRGA